MIYGIHKAPLAKERRITVLLLFVYAIIAMILVYNEQNREKVAESNARQLPQPIKQSNSNS